MTREEKIALRKEQIRKEKLRKNNIILSLILACEIIIITMLVLGMRAYDNKKLFVPDNSADYSIADGDIASIYIKNVPEMHDPNFKINTEPDYVTLTVVGDIMMHEWQIERSYNQETDSFSVDDSYTYISKYLCDADMTIGNLETTLAGRNNGAMTGVLGYSGYPMFNAPECLADTLKDIGFDFLQTANNHSLDSWEDGIYATIDYLDSIGIEHTGTFKTKEENEELCIVEINGITFGFVAYTYGTNGLPVPEEAPYCINTLETYREDLLEEMYSKVRALDEAGVDFVCPLIHFGTEYTEVPDSWQEMVVDGLFEAGADVIFGGHPHVVEPIDVRTITNPDGTTRQGYVVYSFGNFISSQRYDGANKDLGIITDFRFSKQAIDGQIITKVEDIKVEPTYVYWTDTVIGVVPVLEAYNHQDDYSFLSARDWERITYAKDHVIELLMTYGNLQYEIENDKYVITPKSNQTVIDEETSENSDVVE